MRKFIFYVLFFTSSALLSAQSIIGAWERTDVSKEGDTLKSVVIFAEGYQVISTFHAKSGKFVHTNGGTWELDGTNMTEVVEFDSKNPDRVGATVQFEIYLKEDRLGIKGQDMELTRIDSGTPGQLQGAWLMSGRVRDGELRNRNTDRPRKTMKLLSGTRFQWIAYNTETKQFMGTGGGSYTTIDGRYTEQIQFFSRDDTRVGMSLGFDFDLKEKNWHHKGFSSKGAPMHEIWSIRQ